MATRYYNHDEYIMSQNHFDSYFIGNDDISNEHMEKKMMSDEIVNYAPEMRYLEDIVKMVHDREKIEDIVYIRDMIKDLTEFLASLDFPESAHMHSSYEYESKTYHISWDREENHREAAARQKAQLIEQNLVEQKENLNVRVEKAEYKRLHAIYGGDDVQNTMVLEEGV